MAGGKGGSLRDRAGLQTHRLQKQVFLQKSDFGKTCLSAGCFVQKSTLPDPSRFPPVTFQEDFPIECLSFGGLHGCNQKKTPIFIEGAQLHNCRCVQLCLNTILDPGILGDTQTSERQFNVQHILVGVHSIVRCSHFLGNFQ